MKTKQFKNKHLISAVNDKGFKKLKLNPKVLTEEELKELRVDKYTKVI